MTLCALFRAALRSLFGVLLFLTFPAAHAASYHFHDPLPTGTLHVRQPVITWKVWPADGLRITGVSLFVNGRKVPGVYSQGQRAVVYRSPDPLPAGTYAVTCRVEFDNEHTAERDWNFTIASGSSRELPVPDAPQRSVWQMANAFRQRAGLPPLRLDKRLCAAAAAHAAYLERHPSEGHEQRQGGDAGFIAEQPWERLAAFGYGGACYENVAQGNPSLAGAVQALFDAPYHRIAFLQPGAAEFGAGAVGTTVALTFGRTDEEQIVRYPADGQSAVPLSWEGGESPDPLRIHGGASGPLGYPILLARFSVQSGRIKRATATLTTDNGEVVPVYVNTPENDEMLTNAVVLIPRRPLRPNTTYHVSVEMRVGGGAYTAHRWRFVTGRDTGRPERSLRQRSRNGTVEKYLDTLAR